MELERKNGRKTAWKVVIATCLRGVTTTIQLWLSSNNIANNNISRYISIVLMSEVAQTEAKSATSLAAAPALANKLVLVTGASSGIGKATAILAVKSGAKVCAVGRNEEVLKELAKEIGCTYVVGDLTEKGACEQIVKSAVAQLGGLTTLINNAGVLKGGSIDNSTVETFDINFNGNTKSVFEMMQHAIPHLKQAGEGASIVNVSSVNGLQSFAGVAACKLSTDAFFPFLRRSPSCIGWVTLNANCLPSKFYIMTLLLTTSCIGSPPLPSSLPPLRPFLPCRLCLQGCDGHAHPLRRPRSCALQDPCQQREPWRCGDGAAEARRHER